MRIRNRKTVPMKTATTTIFGILPLIFVILFVSQITGIYGDLVAFSLDEKNAPDPTTFISADYTRLAEMAEWTDQRYIEYHIPFNFSTATVFTGSNCTNVSYYTFSDNGALWTGSAMVGWVYKYLAAIRENNDTMKTETLKTIRKLVWGMAMMVIVPNGGLGSNYRGILARGWAPPNASIEGAFFYATHSRHFNGTGAYSQNRWRAYTSNDEYGGYYMAMSLVLKFIDDPEIQLVVRQVIDQIANYMIHTNFLGIHATGAPTGVDQKPFFATRGYWVPLLMKMAAIAYPEKYEDDYYYYMSDYFCYLGAAEASSQETVANYFGYNFGHDVVFAYLLLEENTTSIGRQFFQGYLEGMRKSVQYHRNAYFNAIYLVLYSNTTENIDIQRDVEDQLARFEINHFPDRFNGVLPIPPTYVKVTVFEEMKTRLDSTTYGSLYKVILPDVDLDTIYYTKPLTVEYLHTNNFMWEKCPYEAPSHNYTNLAYEECGTSLTTPYWMMRGCGFIKATGYRII